MPELASGVPEVLTCHLDAIESALRSAIGADVDPLSHAARYVMGWEDDRGRPAGNAGKRIRPGLCLFAADEFGGSPEEAMPGAVAVELVHNFSLVHDEVQDRDDERHHRPTAWRVFGEGQAINLGDHLYTRAIAALTGPGDDVARRMAALAVLNDAIGRMIAGQWQDIAFEARHEVTVDEYLRMAAGKTGALLGAPLEMGALLAGAPAATATVLGRWGTEVGLAFQAWDDYLGTWGDPGSTGKSNTNDIARKKKSLPVVAGLGHRTAGPLIRRVYEQESVSEGDVDTIAAALREIGADEACRSTAAEHAARADELLDALQLPAATRADFRAVGDYFYQRQA